jgi:hypothetical protein
VAIQLTPAGAAGSAPAGSSGKIRANRPLLRDMSVVGPRPPLAAEVRSYDDYAKRRLLVRPGITGLWQVCGRSDLTYADLQHLDSVYVQSWSLIWDLRILMQDAPILQLDALQSLQLLLLFYLRRK